MSSENHVRKGLTSGESGLFQKELGDGLIQGRQRTAMEKRGPNMFKIIEKRHKEKNKPLLIPIGGKLGSICGIGPKRLGCGKLIPDRMNLGEEVVDGLPRLLLHAMKSAQELILMSEIDSGVTRNGFIKGQGGA